MSVSTPVQPDYTAQDGSTYKASIDGAIQVASRLGWGFAAFATPAEYSPTGPDMHVQVAAGHFWTGATATEVAAQEVGPFTAPSTNPRNDLVVIDRATGLASIVTGAEAASPSDPALPAATHPLARVRLTVGQAEITNTDIDDLRSFLLLAGTAAVKDAGTGIGEVPVLVEGDGSPTEPELPAVGGRKLLGLQGLAALSLVEGDILYATGPATLQRLAKGIDDQILSLASGVPVWVDGGAAKYKTGNFTRNFNTATGTQAVTGVGFRPKLVYFHALRTSGGSTYSQGSSEGTTHQCIAEYSTGTGTYNPHTDRCIYIYNGTSFSQHATIQSMDSDGFTLSWVRTGGTPSETNVVHWMAFG